MQLSCKKRLISHLFATHDPDDVVRTGFDIEQYTDEDELKDFADAFRRDRERQEQVLPQPVHIQ